MKKIVFLCTGNTCRSPIAEKMAQKKLEEYDLDIEVVSRGIMVNLPTGASMSAMRAVEPYNLDLSEHQSTEFGIQDVDDDTIILAMTKHHKDYLCYLFPCVRDNVYEIKKFVGETGDIKDPYGECQAIYNKVAEEINQTITMLFDRKLAQLANTTM